MLLPPCRPECRRGGARLRRPAARKSTRDAQSAPDPLIQNTQWVLFCCFVFFTCLEVLHGALAAREDGCLELRVDDGGPVDLGLALLLLRQRLGRDQLPNRRQMNNLLLHCSTLHKNKQHSSLCLSPASLAVLPPTTPSSLLS
jgi:hypothetical protein